jgi:outer membrane protein assembly factor BamB
MTGVAPQANPPTEWSEDKNIKWKAEIPGHGHSTPIVVGDLVILQTAIPANPPKENKDTEQAKAGEQPPPSDGERERGEGRRRRGEGDGGPPPDGARDGERAGRGDGPRGDGPPGDRGPGRGRGMRREAPTEPYKFTVIALDRTTGKQVWERTVREVVPHEGCHGDGSLAPACPVADGEHIIAYFGSRGLYCLTMKGDIVWEKDFGDMQTRAGFGEGSSPALHGDTIVVNWDHEGEDFIIALDKKSGNEKWRQKRDEPTSWSTPLIIERDGRAQVIVSAANRVRSYDLKTGETIWEAGGLGVNCAPTPVADNALVFAMSGYQNPALLAIRYTDAKGDITDSASIAWKTTEGTSYVPSALLYGDTMYFLQKNNGILSCLDPATGKPHYDQQRLEDITGVYSSPVGAADRVYIAGRNGATQVIKRGKSFETIAVNKLDDEFTASPAIVGNELFLRGHKRLYCIAAQ